MTDAEREAARAVGRAAYEKEMAFFLDVMRNAGPDAERSAVQLMKQFADVRSGADVRRLDDWTLRCLARVGCIGMFTVLEAWNERLEESKEA